MDAKMGIAAINIYTFQPHFDLIQEEDCDTLLLHLPGFTKEQVKVKLTSSRVLRISGSRPIGDNKLSSFQKDFPVAHNIDTNKITAKFEDGILYLRQPKLINLVQKITLVPTPQPQKPAANPPPAAQKTDHEWKPTASEATSGADDSNFTGVNDFTEKSEERKDEKKGKTGGIDESNKGEQIYRSSVNDGGEVDDYNAPAMVKIAREKMMKILVFLFAFALGAYVSQLRWFSRDVGK